MNNFCSHCGAKLVPNSPTCSGCGKSLGLASELFSKVNVDDVKSKLFDFSRRAKIGAQKVSNDLAEEAKKFMKDRKK
jgi:hypothetical protein